MDPTESEKEAVPGAEASSGPPAAAQETTASLLKTFDPIAVGGAVGGMTVGEVIGGAIGGVLGAVAGPGGVAVGVGLGAFAGTAIGAKLGYDVTHELVHPEDVKPDATLEERARDIARTTAGKAGDAVGGGIGAAGGALVGTVLAGPLGGEVGAFVGEAIAGELGEQHAAVLYARVEHRTEKAHEAEPAPEARTESNRPDKKEWLANVARETAGETGLAAALGAVGRLIAGNPGRTLGRRAGTVVAKHLNWAVPFTRRPVHPTETPAAAAETQSPPEP